MISLSASSGISATFTTAGDVSATLFEALVSSCSGSVSARVPISQSACLSGFSATFSATAAVISATLFEALVFSCSGSVSAQVPYRNPLVGRGFQRHFRPQLAYTELAGLYSQVVEPFR